MRDLQAGITYINAGTIGAEVHLPVRRHEGHRQRPPRGGPGRARRLHRVEVDLRRLLGQAAARADRHRRVRRSLNREARRLRSARGARRVRDALFAAGAGRIGDYERCSWYTEGTGTFLGGEGTHPAVGEAGREERVAELRLETVYPGRARGRGRRRAARGASVRGARVRPLPARCEGAALHRRRRARQPRPGGVRLRARGRGRDRARRARRGDRRRDEQRRRVPRAWSPGSSRRSSCGVDELEVVSDSELLVKQMRGEYKVKNEALRELVDRGARARAPARQRRATRPSAASTTSSPTGSSTRRSTQALPETRGYTCASARM